MFVEFSVEQLTPSSTILQIIPTIHILTSTPKLNFQRSNHAPGFYSSFLFFQENSNDSRIVIKKDKDVSIDVSKYLKRA
jgi:hypothetical protein